MIIDSRHPAIKNKLSVFLQTVRGKKGVSFYFVDRREIPDRVTEFHIDWWGIVQMIFRRSMVFAGWTEEDRQEFLDTGELPPGYGK